MSSPPPLNEGPITRSIFRQDSAVHFKFTVEPWDGALKVNNKEQQYYDLFCAITYRFCTCFRFVLLVIIDSSLIGETNN